MAAKFSNTELTMRFIKLAEGLYRPIEIEDLERQIEAETQAAELEYLMTGIIDPERVQNVVEMRLHLDALCVAWAKGEIS